MKKSATIIFVLFLCIQSFSQKDSVEAFFAFRISDYTVKLNDSVTIVQLNLPDALPLAISNSQIGILKHRYENGEIDTTLIGWGRCHLVKGNFYYFAIHKYHDEEPEQGDLLYTKCKTPAYYKSVLFDINRHAINLTTVMDDQFCHATDIFYLDKIKEKKIIDSMVSDIRFTGKSMKDRGDAQNQLVAGGIFDGKKLFDVMRNTTAEELMEFLKYLVARPDKYAGNLWKLSEIFATWVVSKSPQVIPN